MAVRLSKLPWYGQVGAFLGLSVAGLAAFFYLYVTPMQEEMAQRQRKLDALQAASTTQDLSALPGNRFEDLKHTKPGFYSVRVNDQYRIFFRFLNGDAYDVELEGYDQTGRR